MVDWLVYAFMFPVLILIASIAMLTGISGTAMMTPFLILVFPVLGVPTLTPAQAIGIALFTMFFGPVSGGIGYQRRGLIDYRTAWRLAAVAVPTIVVFSLLSQSVGPTLLRGAYGTMMVLLAAYLAWTAPGNVRRWDLKVLPAAAERFPRRAEAPVQRLIRSRDGREYRYRVCDPHRGYLITAAGAAMMGLVSVGLGELEMPNLVKRCKIPVAVSAATSVFVMAVAVLAGSVTDILALVQQGGLGAVPWNLVLYTVPGAVIGGQLGARFQGRISSGATERFIAILFALVGIAFLAAILIG